MSDDELTPSAQPSNPARRALLDVAVAVTATAATAAALYPALRMLAPLDQPMEGSVSLGPLEDLAPGSAQSALLDGRPIVVLRAANGDVRAFDAVCPHMGCVVQVAVGGQELSCGCHRGRFNALGRPIAGPPSAPLSQLTVLIMDGQVMIMRAG